MLANEGMNRPVTRPAGVLVVFVLVLGCMGAYEANGQQDLAASMKDFSSSDFLKATAGMKALFSAGTRSIPFLAQGFGNLGEFTGLCGSHILESSCEPYYPGITSDKSEKISVREASLYLVVAISKGKLYFAQRCKPVNTSGTGEPDVTATLKEVYEALADAEKQQTPLSAEKIGEILRSHHVGFSETGK